MMGYWESQAVKGFCFDKDVSKYVRTLFLHNLELTLFLKNPLSEDLIFFATVYAIMNLSVTGRAYCADELGMVRSTVR